MTITQTASSFAAFPPSWKWKTIRSDHFTIYYPRGHETTAQRIYNLTDEVYRDITEYFGVTPPKCPIIIHPGTDIFNGFFSPFPNRISLYETPPYYIRGFGPASDIEDLLFTHEFTHFVHLTMSEGWYRHISALLGPGSRISNILAPGWVIEGVTTNTETLFTDGGRGRCSYFSGEFLSCTEGDGLWGLSASGIYSPYSPPGGRFYLSGYHMVKYLNDNYGRDAFARFSRHQARHPVGGASGALRHVTGVSPKQFYKDFTRSIEDQAEKQKAEAASTGLPRGESICFDPLGTIDSFYWTDSGTITALRKSYKTPDAIIEIDTQNKTVVNEIRTGRFNTVSPIKHHNTNDDNILVTCVYPHPLGEGELLNTDITTFNKSSGKITRVTRNRHIFSADFSPAKSSFVATQRNGMWIDLVFVDTVADSVTPLISKKGLLFEAPRWSPDGSVIAVTLKSGGNTDIVMVDPVSGEFESLYTSDRYEENDPVFSPDGKWLLFSSNRSGPWNIFGWHFDSETLYQLTSVDYGATAPAISPDGKTLAFLSLNQGVNALCTTDFSPSITGKKIATDERRPIPAPNLERLHPEVSFSPSSFPLKEAYRPFLHIPYFEADEDQFTLGIWLNGMDPVGLNGYSASIFHTTVADITPANDLDDEQSEGFLGWDITLFNRSLWPTLQLRISEHIHNGTVVWYNEKEVEAGASLNLINRSMPSMITTNLFGGGRYRHRTSETPGLVFREDTNDSTALFGEVTLSRFPDYPARDIIPTKGQMVYISHEEGLEELGGEIPSRNSVFTLTQYFPSLFSHHGIFVKGAYQTQDGLSYSKDLSLPRGYSEDDTEGGLNLDKNILLRGEYHFPIAYPDAGVGLTLFHVHALKGSFFLDWGAGWENDYDHSHIVSIARKTIGGSLTCKAGIFSLFSFETGLEAGYKTEDDEEYYRFVFTAGF